MYQRFKRGLFIPSELAIYLNDTWLKVWVYFFLLVTIASLPFLMVSYGSYGFSNAEKIAFKDNYVTTLSGSHQIVDGELFIASENLGNARFLRLDIYTIGIVNTPTSPEYQGIRMIFTSNGIRLSTLQVPNRLYSYSELGIENFDFSNYSTQNIDQLIRALDIIVKDHHVTTKVYQTFLILGSTFIELMFFVLISAAFAKQMMPFNLKFKIAVYVLTVYVITSLFALILNTGIFIFIGIILMMIYMRLAFSKLNII